MKHYLIKSHTRDGDFEYFDRWLIASDKPLPDDAEGQITAWNHGLYFDEDELDDEYWTDDGMRLVSDSIEMEVPENHVKTLKKYLTCCSYEDIERYIETQD
jgi:hypothetical protein